MYGTIAEMGAGQEVARWFLTVGGASGTVVQTISAYDKTFSDATYWAGTRFVSKERLVAMLDREYRLLIERLGPERAAGTRFFAFADTASSRNYKGDNEQRRRQPSGGVAKCVRTASLRCLVLVHAHDQIG